MRSHLLTPGAQTGQTFTTSTGTFTEVPDALLQKTTVRLNVEIMGTLSSLAGPEANTKTVLEETFNDVGLVSQFLSIGHFVNTTTIPVAHAGFRGGDTRSPIRAPSSALPRTRTRMCPIVSKHLASSIRFGDVDQHSRAPNGG